MARVNRWTVVSGGGESGKLVIVPRDKDKPQIIELLRECFGSYDESLYAQETSGSFSHFLVYKIGKEIVAACSVYLKDGYTMFGRLCVKPSHRKQGLARLILNYLKAKYPVLVWTTNTPELDEFYKKMDGKKTGVKNGFVYWKWTR